MVGSDDPMFEGIGRPQKPVLFVGWVLIYVWLYREQERGWGVGEVKDRRLKNYA